MGFGLTLNAINNLAMPNPIHDPKYTIFRELLTAARTEQGLLQSDVAERIRKNQSFVSKYERGERRLDMPEFVEVSEALGIDIVDFIAQYRARLKERQS